MTTRNPTYWKTYGTPEGKDEILVMRDPLNPCAVLLYFIAADGQVVRVSWATAATETAAIMFFHSLTEAKARAAVADCLARNPGGMA